MAHFVRTLIPWTQKDPVQAMVLALAILFLMATAGMSYALGPLVNSPDEMANLAFARQFSENSSLRIQASEIGRAFDLAPRSVSFSADAYVPASFYGLPVVYGSVMAVFGEKIIWFLTPLIVALAGLAFFGLIRHVWGERIALVSGLLYFLHPVLWYYTVRGLFNNALFMSLLLIGLYLLVVRPMRWKVLADVLSYVAIMLALFVRTSEALWVGALLLLLWLFTKSWRNRALTLTWLVCVGVTITAAYVLGVTDLWRGGYVTQGIGSTLSSLVFPFGFNPHTASRAAWNYGFLLLAFVVLTYKLGFLAYAYQTIRTKKVFSSPSSIYAVLILLLAWYPLLMYGSWLVKDNPTPWLVTIGNSYLRYWLPLFVFALPFSAYLLVFLFEKYTAVSRRYAAGIWVGFFVFWLVQSVYVFYAGADGYGQLSRQQKAAEVVQQQVLTIVQPDDVLITDKWDKVFWPSRTVGRGIHQPWMQQKVRAMVAKTQVYYFGLRFTSDEAAAIAKNDVRATEQKTFGDHVLYQLTAR